MARTPQKAQRRNSVPVQFLAVPVGAAQPRPCPDANPPVDLTDRARGRRATIIAVTPEKACCGKIDTQAGAVERYKLDGVHGGSADPITESPSDF